MLSPEIVGLGAFTVFKKCLNCTLKSLTNPVSKAEVKCRGWCKHISYTQSKGIRNKVCMSAFRALNCFKKTTRLSQSFSKIPS